MDELNEAYLNNLGLIVTDWIIKGHEGAILFEVPETERAEAFLLKHRERVPSAIAYHIPKTEPLVCLLHFQGKEQYVAIMHELTTLLDALGIDTPIAVAPIPEDLDPSDINFNVN